MEKEILTQQEIIEILSSWNNNLLDKIEKLYDRIDELLDQFGGDDNELD